ncbi:hypothetical protein Taro_039873 [Colocasia esculenta]|uniref:Polysaccharide biosynthesis domain-containing protein n=1 Tax=Colocasia esculenta TaxID=4460 RepID=A0A843WWX0_COLES|nr:hypothetical protein [Colocasia esculenta]
MRVVQEKPWFVAVAGALVIAGAFLISSFARSGDRAILCSLGTYSLSSSSGGGFGTPDASTGAQLAETVLHYATTGVTPQQSRPEIRISFDVLRQRGPCNFLVFGLGHDSLMWSAFNAGGTTLFLEEDPKWVQTVLKDDATHTLRAKTVRYPTQLQQADELLRSYRSEPKCLPPGAFLKGNRGCRLALADLPEEVYEREWDLIMIDAPRGYFNEAPGRMGAIYSAAVMARNRRGEGDTHVFLHDVDRRVEKTFAMEFLCKRYLVKGTGRLWHFRIPSVRDEAANSTRTGGFC